MRWVNLSVLLFYCCVTFDVKNVTENREKLCEIFRFLQNETQMQDSRQAESEHKKQVLMTIRWNYNLAGNKN